MMLMLSRLPCRGGQREDSHIFLVLLCCVLFQVSITLTVYVMFTYCSYLTDYQECSGLSRHYNNYNNVMSFSKEKMQLWCHSRITTFRYYILLHHNILRQFQNILNGELGSYFHNIVHYYDGHIVSALAYAPV